MSAPIAVPVGDPAGVGPEVAVAAVAQTGVPAVLIGDLERLGAELERLGATRHDLSVEHAARWSQETISARAATVEGGRAQLAALDRAIEMAIAGRARAITTGPVAKEAIVRAGTSFTGQTEHVAERCGLAHDDVTMCFVGPRLSISLVTTHLALRNVAEAITAERVERATVHLAELLRARGTDNRLRLAVLGLNPHAGEGGLFGDEERSCIAPGLAAAARRLGDSASVVGPIPAESGLRQASEGRYDGVVAMFHDQATIASKLLDWGSAVNVTWGLPFPRTSVDHGVAYDIAGRGRADPAGMVAALCLADRLSARA